MTGKGFKLGSIFIRPQDNTTEGYIPYPPYYMDKRTLDSLLTEYGDLTYSDFTATEHGTWIAGYKFAIRMKTNKTLPATITYNDFDMTIRLKDDIRYCTYCKRYGHTTGLCHTRKQDDVTYTQKRKDAREAQTAQYENEVEAIHQTEVEAITTLNNQFSEEMQRITDEHTSRVAECKIEGISEAELLLMHHAFKIRQEQETIEKEQIEADLKGRYEQKRATLVQEYGKMGFRVTGKSKDK